MYGCALSVQLLAKERYRRFVSLAGGAQDRLATGAARVRVKTRSMLGQRAGVLRVVIIIGVCHLRGIGG